MLTWNDVSVIVRATHGKRLRERNQLLGRLSGCGNVVVVESHPGGEPSRRQFVRALSQADREWALLVEDDAWPCDGFADHAIRRLNRQTFVILSLYSGRSALAEDGDEVMRVPPSQLSMSVALFVPSAIAAPLAAYLPEWEAANPQHKHAADYFLRDFCVRERLPVAYTRPSLCQHRPGPSTLGHGAGRRYSPSFLRAFGEIPC